MFYIGIDIAKSKHYASVVDNNGTIIVNAFAFYNSRKGFEFLLSKLDKLDLFDCLFGLESTGHYGNNLISFLFSKGLKIGRINPIQTNALRKTNIRKTKTDEIDTVLISKCLILGNYTLITNEDIDIISLKSLCRFRFDTVQSITKLKLQLRACVDQLFPELNTFFRSGIHIATSYALLEYHSSPEAISHIRIDTLAKLLHSKSRGKYTYDDAVVLKDLAKESIGINNPALSIQISYYIKQINLLKQQLKSVNNQIKTIMDLHDTSILSIPGVGYTLGAMIISEIGDIKRFSHPSKLLAFSGLDPSIIQSGNFTATNTKISKRGSPYLRFALCRAANLIIWNNKTFHDYYTKKLAQGKSHNNVVGHVAFKLVRVIFKMLNDNTKFDLD